MTTSVSNTKSVNVHDTLQPKKVKGRLEKQTFYHPGLMASDVELQGFPDFQKIKISSFSTVSASPTRIMLFEPLPP
jgi:hypothetical protein